jgi:hypothetical protein
MTMTSGQLSLRVVIALALGCGACVPDGEDPSDVKQQNVVSGDGGSNAEEDAEIGWLEPSGPVLHGDAGVEVHADGAVHVEGDAGQGDAGQDPSSDEQGDAGQAAEEPEPTNIPHPRILLAVETDPNVPDCNTVYYRDMDADGFGDDKFSITSCTQPAGYVEIGGDCYDLNDRAHPDATGAFLQQRGDGSFDYDCDGVETQLHTKWAACPAENSGWTDFRTLPCTGAACPADKAKLPACGQAAYWGLTVTAVGATHTCSMPVEGELRTQTCR